MSFEFIEIDLCVGRLCFATMLCFGQDGRACGRALDWDMGELASCSSPATDFPGQVV